MELSQVYELWNRFDASSTVELELELQGAKLHLRKDTSAQVMQGPMSHESMLKTSASLPGSSQAESATTAVSATAASYKEIKAPLVGTFYQGPAPDAEPFVKVGQQVKKGQVIGIIEAMKLMNEVLADCDGEVVEIAAEDASFVEYDQVLIRLQ